MLKEGWSSFHEQIQIYPSPADTPNAKWDPLNPKVRFMNLSAEEMMSFYVALIKDNVIAPLIDNGESSKDVLLSALQNMHQQLEYDSGQSTTEEFDDIFQELQNRIKGVAAFVSPQYGFMKSKQSHAKNLQQDGEASGASWYNTLCKHPDYQKLVSEYWATIDASDKFIPQVKKLEVKVEKLSVDRDAVQVLVISVALLKEATPLVRRTQTDRLKELVLDKVSMLCSHVVAKSTSEEWIADVRSDIKALLATIEGVGDVTNAAGAKASLEALDLSGAKGVGLKSSAEQSDSVVKLLESKGSVFDVGRSELEQFMVACLSHGDIVDGSDAATAGGSALTAAITLLAKPAAELTLECEVLAKTAVDSLNGVVAFARYLNALLPDSMVCKHPKGVYDTYVSVSGSVNALLLYRLTGVDAAARLSADLSAEHLRAAIAARQKMNEVFADAESEPGALSALLKEAACMLDAAQDTPIPYGWNCLSHFFTPPVQQTGFIFHGCRANV